METGMAKDGRKDAPSNPRGAYFDTNAISRQSRQPRRRHRVEEDASDEMRRGSSGEGRRLASRDAININSRDTHQRGERYGM